MELKNGSRVRLSETSDFYGTPIDHPEWNPTDMSGTVLSTDEGGLLPILVKWDNGITNGYNEEDLIVLAPSNVSPQP
jgi:hypothetical protein